MGTLIQKTKWNKIYPKYNMSYEAILKKLQSADTLDKWSTDDKLAILKLYYLISKKEALLCDLVYDNHGCDSWEDIFRDYDTFLLKEKAVGIKIAITEVKCRRPCKDCGQSIYSKIPWYRRCTNCARAHKKVDKK